MVKLDSKILIFMCDDRFCTDESYVKYSVLINKTYAKKHNYDFKFFLSNNSESGRHPAWNKLEISVDLIKNNEYDHYLYLDTDYIFNKQQISLYKYFNSINLSRNDIGSNIVFIKDSIHRSFPCSGFFIFNNLALPLLLDWKDNHSENDKIFYYKHSWEQMILQNRKDKYKIKIINDNHFITNSNAFMTHLAFKSHNFRLKYLRRYYSNMLGAFNEVFSNNDT